MSARFKCAWCVARTAVHWHELMGRCVIFVPGVEVAHVDPTRLYLKCCFVTADPAVPSLSQTITVEEAPDNQLAQLDAINGEWWILPVHGLLPQTRCAAAGTISSTTVLVINWHEVTIRVHPIAVVDSYRTVL